MRPLSRDQIAVRAAQELRDGMYVNLGIDIPTLDQAPEASKPLLAAVQQQLGMVPNLMKVVGLSPAALEGYLSLRGCG